MEVNTKKHLPILDFLRCVASLGVCAVHMHYYCKLDEYKLTSKILTYGQQGVAVFFVISGFVIPYSLWNAGYIFKDFPRYLLKRVVRIDPSYCVIILLSLVFLFQWSNINWAQLALHFFYLIPFSGYSWYQGVFWTLGIEFQYYLLIGILFSALKNGNIYIVCSVLMIVSCIGYFVPLKHAYAFIFMHIHYFAMGILCVLYAKNRISLKAVHVLLAAICIYLCLRVSILSALAGYVPCIFILHVNFRTGLTDFFSRISYSLYLIHSLAGLLILKVLSYFQVQDRYLMFTVLMMANISFAYLLYIVVEKPSLRLSKKIKMKRDEDNIALTPQGP